MFRIIDLRTTFFPRPDTHKRLEIAVLLLPFDCNGLKECHENE